MPARWQLPINLALYQAGWFACVFGAGAGRPWTGGGLALVLVAVHLALVRDRGSELKLVLAAGPLSFFAGERASAIQFASLSAYGVLACAWAVAMPALVWLSDRLQPNEGSYG